jgi:hypothetical protein
MGYVIAFAPTAGIKRIYPSVPVSKYFFETSGITRVFPSVIVDNPFFETSGKAYSFAGTVKDAAFFESSGIHYAFARTLSDYTGKLLELKWGSFELASDYSIITVFDNTGTYDAETNPGGYNPEAATPDPNRAKRSEVKLWLAYRVWKDSTSVPDVIFPSPVDPDAIDWEYQLPINEYGVYQLFLIASPTAKIFADIEAQGNSIFDYANKTALWYATAGGGIVSPEIINCINKKRYGFIESVMCGSCDEDYLSIYSKYIGALSAIQVGTDEAYLQGMKLIEEIKDECNKIDCNCNC